MKGAPTARIRPTALAALLAMLALVASACGGEAGGGAEREPGSAPTPAGDQTQAGAKEPDDGIDGRGTATQKPSGGSCYEGETATFVVSFRPGGGFDTIARMVSPFLEDELGATVVVENQAGAGGLLAANNLLAAEPDGLTFGFFSGGGIAGSALGGAEGVQFDLLDFTHIARVSGDSRVMTVGAQSEYETIQDVMDADGFTFATSGAGSSDHIDAYVLSEVLDIDGDIITGFAGSSETELAVTTGDADAMAGAVGSRLPAIENGDHRPVLLIGDQRHPELPDVPAVTELELSEDKMQLAEAQVALQGLGRTVWAPPGVPEDCAEELTAAFEAALSDPQFLEQAEKAGQDISFLSGEEVRALVQELFQAPEEYVALLEQAYSGQ